MKTSSAGQMAQKWIESRALGGVSRLALCAGVSVLLLASAAPAQAQFGWFGASAVPFERGYMVRERVRSPAARRHVQRHGRTKAAVAAKEEPAKPIVGPLIISISVNKQHLTVYDGDRPVASTVVSTGVKGHETPFGVFSVLQKELLHHSNLYSNAPMPHMQRITWSGVALHAGHVTGRQASHGCIRLPAAFATRLYGMTKVGARVIISRDPVVPTEFSSPRLFTMQEGATTPTASAAPGRGATLQPGSVTDRVRAAGQVASLDKLPIPRTSASDGSAESALQATTAADLPPSAYAEMAPTPEEMAAAKAADAASPGQGDAGAAAQAAVPMSGPAGAAAPATKPAAPSGPISIFVSRKEKKLFVRRNFKPIYAAPVTFDGDQPLGTHVFTATNAPADGTTLHWVTMSIASANPALSPELKTHRSVAAREARGHKVQPQPAIPPALPMATPNEALERVQITPEVRDQIAAMITPGSSLVISDKGLGGETSPKAGTDFIVLTH
ncbi:MAG: L,D-transpeptidase [Methylobacteriaceae bacterium]|nr:L,D-transpeptidase [Methylobacteriaceae bacterium]